VLLGERYPSFHATQTVSSYLPHGDNQWLAGQSAIYESNSQCRQCNWPAGMADDSLLVIQQSLIG